MFKVFVYGTLKEGKSLFWRPMVSEVTVDSLSNYSLYEREEAWFPFLYPNEGGVAHGEVHTYRHLGYLKQLDRIEGVPHLYTREEVVTDKGEKVFVYVATSIDEDVTKIEGQWEPRV